MNITRSVLAGLLVLGGLTGAAHAGHHHGDRCTPTNLRDGADERGLLVGAAIAMDPLRNEPEYAAVARREFNVIVAENAFKMGPLRPAIDTFNFTDADALVQFARANRMKLRGHTLVWHNQNPAWLDSGSWTRDQAIEILRNHISTVVGRYKGQVFSWDVVNEAFVDGPSGALRDTIWLRTIGPDYIKLAFEFAHQADPSATLYYNDYNIEGVSAKSNAVYNLVTQLLAEGVPIHGVGWQSHFINPFRVGAEHQTNARRLADLGLEISITELDVRIALPTTPDELDQQALAYGDLLRLCLTERNCKAFVVWGFTDKYSWIPGVFAGQGDALPFDATYQPKPAYTALLDILAQDPPSVPRDLRAHAGDGRVRLSWDRSRHATSYNVKRAASRQGPYVLVSSVTGTSFTDTGVINGQAYYYRVSASNANEQSRDSAHVRAEPRHRRGPHGRWGDEVETVAAPD